MAFDWSWNGILRQAAQQGMEGYNPNAANAAAQMQGYAPTPVVDAGSQGGAVARGNAMQVSQQQAMQEQAANQNAQRIEQIKAQIAEIEKRIATNTAKLQNFTGNTDQIAAIEARKINSQDPTSIWRWKEGVNQQRIQRQQDLERIEKEKKLNEAKNIELNRNKIDNILQSTMPNQNMTRDKMDMAVKQLNDAEELAKQYKDNDSLKKINARKNELGIYVPVDDEANIIESDFVKNMEMVGKKGGMDKKQFAQYVQNVLDDPNNKHIWHYSPELQRKLYAAIGKNTGAKPTNYAGY
jgi:hypothetical protein